MSQDIVVQTLSLTDGVTLEVMVHISCATSEQDAVNIIHRYAKDGMAYRYLGKRRVLKPSSVEVKPIKIGHSENLVYWAKA